MKAVVQRVKQSSVAIDNKIFSEIKKGLLVFLGVSEADRIEDVIYLAEKIIHLRIFDDEHGKMNRSLFEIGGEVLIVSQFTLLGDCRKGRRPSYVDAAKPEKANELYEKFTAYIEDKGIQVKTGIFRAMMDVSLVNHGPVTLILESKKI